MSRIKEQVFSNRYRIIGQLGSGGMAEVYKAEDTILNRTVALKLLHPRLAHQENFIQRLRREAQAAANLNHPNIVNIYDWGNQNDTYYIVMEYLKGESLKAIIDREAPLATARALKIAIQVCEALQFAHDHDVVHRDIKPHNIIINDKGVVRVTDFGIARAGNSTGATQTGSVLGTAKYVSPEQAQGAFVGHTSDVYSLGVVLYEMVTGQVPFEGESAVALAYKHVHEQPPRPSKYNPNISLGLERIILKALEKEPAKRFATAQEFRDALKSVLGSEASEQRAKDKVSEPLRPSRKDRPVKKNSSMIAAIAIVLVLTAALVAYALLGGPSKNRVPDFSGRTLAQAQALAKDNHFVIEVSGKKASDEVEVGFIISQTPRAGSRLAAGETIQLLLSTGKPRIKVPDVSGKNSEEAGFILGQSSLEIGEIKREFSETIPDGQVISQDPAAGQLTPEGTIVNLVVSRGEESIDVPNLRDKTRAEAETILSDIGFDFQIQEAFSDLVPKDQVIDQNPLPGQKASKDSKIIVTISQGPELIGVPALIGLNEGDAKITLDNAGLKYSIVEKSTEGGTGKVIDQYPKAETQIKRGSTVTIYVDKKQNGQPPDEGGSP